MEKVSAAVTLKYMSNLCMRYLENNSHKKDIEAITGTNGWIIAYIQENENKDIFQRDLEKQFGITRSTASKVINLMISKGLVEHKSVEYDARLKKLVLTDKARAIVSLIKEDGEMLERVLLSDIPEEEMNVFFGCIKKMKDNIEKTLK